MNQESLREKIEDICFRVWNHGFAIAKGYPSREVSQTDSYLYHKEGLSEIMKLIEEREKEYTVLHCQLSKAHFEEYKRVANLSRLLDEAEKALEYVSKYDFYGTLANTPNTKHHVNVVAKETIDTIRKGREG